MMNTGNIQGMVPRGATLGNQPNQSNQNGPPRQPQGMQQQFTNQIIANLSKTPLNPGWQSTLPIHIRASFIIQLVTALRLLPDHVEVNGAIQVATLFERNTLEKSPDKATYEAACQEKLRAIHFERQKLAQSFESQYRNPQAAQMNFTIQQMQMQQQMRNVNMQNSRPTQFPPGLQTEQSNGSLQASPMPKLQQPFAQVQQQQFLPGSGLANTQLSMQQFQQNSNPSQNLGRQMLANAGQVTFSPQENQQINMMAQQFRQKAGPQEIETIKQKINNAPPNQKLAWQQQNIDPMAWYFRKLAHNSFLQLKNRQIAAQQQLQVGSADGMSMAPQQSLLIPQSSSSMAGQQFQAASAPQGFDPSYGGNFQQFGSHISGLQQQGLRSQEEGQVVVPASGTQNPSQQQHQQTVTMQDMSQHSSMSQPNPPRPIPNHPQFLVQQEKMQQVARMQAQAQIQNAGGMQIQPSAHNALQGQAGGLNGHMNQAVSQQSPAMPTLNKPLGPSMQQPPTNGTLPQRQQNNSSQGQSQDSGTLSQFGQQIQQTSGSVNPINGSVMIGEQKKPQQMAFMNVQNMPPDMQAKFNSLPPEQQRAFRINLQKSMSERHRQQVLASKTMSSGSSAVPRDLRIDHQAQVNGQRSVPREPDQAGLTQNTVNGPLAVSQPQDMSSTTASSQQLFPMSTPGTGQNFQQQKQQTNQQRFSQSQMGPLTEEQTRKMDEQPFPPNILTTQTMQSLFPQGLRLWGELKEWVKDHVNIMPPDMSDKLEGLQRLHYQNIYLKHQIQNRQQQRLRQQAINESQQPSASSQQPGPAPPAQMVPAPSSQIPVPNMNSASIGLPRIMPLAPGYSLEEIRIHYPHFKDWSDERIKEFMVARKRQLMEQQLIQRQNSTLQQSQYENMQRAQNQQSLRQGFGPAVQNVSSQSQQMPNKSQSAAPTSNTIPTHLNTQGGLQGSGQESQPRGQARPSNQPLPNQKSTKRNNEDDVVEVPNPNIALQQHRRLQQTGKPNTNVHKLNASALKREASSIGAQQQQQQQQQQSSQYELELRKHAAQATPAPSIQQPQTNVPNLSVAARASRSFESTERMKVRYNELQNEVLQALPLRKEVMVDQQTREHMIMLLKNNIDYVKRFRAFEPTFLFMTRNEETTKEIIRCRILIVRQFRDQEFNVVDHFTITHQELEHCVTKLKKEFNLILNHANRQRSLPRPQQSVQTPVDGSIIFANSATRTQKQESDSQTLQALRQPTMQRTHSNRDNRAPAAPTSDKPPFSFNAQSPPPDGVPLAYGPRHLTQDKLSIPPTKKRKVQNQGAGSAGPSTQAQHTSRSNASPQISKAPSPKAPKPGPIGQIIKCSFSNCEVGAKGFKILEDLARHTKEKHETVEPVIDDPLEWALEGIRLGLHIDADGKASGLNAQKAEAGNKSSTAMQHSASSQGGATVKLDLGTTMSRNPTQNDHHSDLGLPKISQNAEPSSLKRGKAEPYRTVSTSVKPLTPPRNQWDGTSISPTDLAAYFPTALSLQSSFDLATLTPESTTPSDKSEKDSPKVSDISEGDGLNISLEAESWLPPAFFDDTTLPNTDFRFADDDILGMDWESSFGSVAPEGSTKDGVKGSSAPTVRSAFDISLFAVE